MAAPSIPNWQAQILHGIGAPVTPANVTFLNAWTRAEGGEAENNPFNTTQPGFGTVGNYNSVGVKRYATPAGGINATVHTLLNGRYGNILSALKQGSDARLAAQALANSPWGTGALVLKILGGHPQPQTAPPVTPFAPGVPPSRPQRAPVAPGGITAGDSALLAEGARLFGLPSVPLPVTSSAPLRLPKAGLASPSPAPAPPTPTTRGSRPNGKPSLPWLEHQAAPFGLTITATTNGHHAPHSYHYQSRAVDLAGPPQRMAAAANYALQHPGEFTEMFYTGPGHPDYFISAGKVYPLSQLDPGLYAEHTNHVHWAR